jgi:multiple antibiotic resistance protein
MTVFSVAFLLFLVMDPFGNIPFFIIALKNVDERRRRKIIIRELLIALCVLVVFLFTGQYILKILQISEPSLTIAGGIILFLISIKMIFPSSTGGMFEEKLSGEPFIVPLAIPYVAGPSALAAVLFIMSREPARWLEWLFALILAWFTSGIIIILSSGLKKFLGERGLIAIERLMGMVLITIAVQMLMSGISQFVISMPK